MRQVLVPSSIAGAAPPAGSRMAELTGHSMGTTWSARVIHGGAALGDALQAELDKVVAQMSHWEPGSNLSRYNDAPAGSWHELPNEFFSVIQYATWVRDASGGAYDPFAGALVDCWGFGAQRRYHQEGFSAPPAQAVAQLLAQRPQIELDTTCQRLRQPGGARIDLSSVAKGFAVDQLARTLEARGVHHYLVEVGGELRGAGMKQDQQPWWVALEGLPDLPGATPAVVALHGLSIATSGDYRQHYRYEGRRQSHTLDPRSGYPIHNGIASVTVLHPECMAADALSTAISVLGPTEGMAFAEQHRVAVRILIRSAQGLLETTSSAYQAMLQ
ncbi:MAG: FAD:protein FMN transferase [Pseudomonadota bacterium]